MAIDGFSESSIANSEVDPDSPLNTTLITEIRDGLEFLQRWVGKTGLANATADHAHAGFALDGTSAIAGASGGQNLAAFYDEMAIATTPSAHGTTGCNFTPDWLIGFDPYTAGNIWSKNAANASGTAHSLSSIGSISNITILKHGGAYLTSSAITGALLAFKASSGNIAFGGYTGNGTSQSITGVGFQPEFLLIQRDVPAVDALFRTSGFSSTDSKVREGSLVTTGVTSIDSDGFTVGSGVWVNTSAVEFSWLALRSGTFNGEQIQLDNYTGDGTTPRTIVNSAGFPPQAAFIIETGTTGATFSPAFAFSRMDRESQLCAAGTFESDIIIDFLSDGVTVGSSLKSNDSGKSYDIIFFSGGTRP